MSAEPDGWEAGFTRADTRDRKRAERDAAADLAEGRPEREPFTGGEGNAVYWTAYQEAWDRLRPALPGETR